MIVTSNNADLKKNKKEKRLFRRYKMNEEEKDIFKNIDENGNVIPEEILNDESFFRWDEEDDYDKNEDGEELIPVDPDIFLNAMNVWISINNQRLKKGEISKETYQGIVETMMMFDDLVRREFGIPTLTELEEMEKNREK